MDDLRKELIEDELKVNRIKSILYFLDGKGKKPSNSTLSKSTPPYTRDLPKFPIERIKNEKGVHDCTEEELKVWGRI